ncbi:hypothetical protein FRB93_013204 [Tulasnella sp. JGI-2019a]|nr:hypothetical protein FRB93_013204 [Tulasnella sp. JGI-2019a]
MRRLHIRNNDSIKRTKVPAPESWLSYLTRNFNNAKHYLSGEAAVAGSHIAATHSSAGAAVAESHIVTIHPSNEAALAESHIAVTHPDGLVASTKINTRAFKEAAIAAHGDPSQLPADLALLRTNAIMTVHLLHDVTPEALVRARRILNILAKYGGDIEAGAARERLDVHLAQLRSGHPTAHHIVPVNTDSTANNLKEAVIDAPGSSKITDPPPRITIDGEEPLKRKTKHATSQSGPEQAAIRNPATNIEQSPEPKIATTSPKLKPNANQQPESATSPLQEHVVVGGKVAVSADKPLPPQGIAPGKDAAAAVGQPATPNAVTVSTEINAGTKGSDVHPPPLQKIIVAEEQNLLFEDNQVAHEPFEHPAAATVTNVERIKVHEPTLINTGNHPPSPDVVEVAKHDQSVHPLNSKKANIETTTGINRKAPSPLDQTHDGTANTIDKAAAKTEVDKKPVNNKVLIAGTALGAAIVAGGGAVGVTKGAQIGPGYDEASYGGVVLPQP